VADGGHIRTDHGSLGIRLMALANIFLRKHGVEGFDDKVNRKPPALASRHVGALRASPTHC